MSLNAKSQTGSNLNKIGRGGINVLFIFIFNDPQSSFHWNPQNKKKRNPTTSMMKRPTWTWASYWFISDRCIQLVYIYSCININKKKCIFLHVHFVGCSQGNDYIIPAFQMLKKHNRLAIWSISNLIGPDGRLLASLLLLNLNEIFGALPPCSNKVIAW